MSEQQATYATVPVNPRPWSWLPYPIGSLMPNGYFVHTRGRTLCMTPLPMYVIRPYVPRYPKRDNTLRASGTRPRRQHRCIGTTGRASSPTATTAPPMS